MKIWMEHWNISILNPKFFEVGTYFGLSAFITFNYQLLAIPFLRGYNIGNGIMGQQTEVVVMLYEKDVNDL